MKNKKIIAMITALAIPVLLVGCGDDKKNEDSKGPEVNISDNVSDLTEDSSNKTEDSSNKTEDSSNKTEDSSNKTEDSSNKSDKEDAVSDKKAVERYVYSYDKDSKRIFDMNRADVEKKFGLEYNLDEYEMFEDTMGLTLTYKDNSNVVGIYEDSVYSLISKDNKIGHIRGIEIGDSIESVLSNFPKAKSEERKEYDLEENCEYATVYGEYLHRSDYGIVIFEKGTDKVIGIRLGDEATAVDIKIADESVLEIEYILGLS